MLAVEERDPSGVALAQQDSVLPWLFSPANGSPKAEPAMGRCYPALQAPLHPSVLFPSFCQA